MNGFDVRPSACGGYTAYVAGTELHVAFHRPGVLTRRMVRDLVGPMLQQHGLVTTRVPAQHETLRRFVERVGFTWSWADTNYDYYIMTDMPFEKR